MIPTPPSNDHVVTPHEATILAWLTAQDFAPGAKLPSERELGEALHLTRHQIRLTLIALEQRGQLERIKDGWWIPGTGADDLSKALVIFAAAPAAVPGEHQRGPNQMSRVWSGMAVAAARQGVRLMTVLSTDLTSSTLSRLAKQRPLGMVCLSDAVRHGEALTLARAVWPTEIPVVAMGDWVQPDELAQWPADLVFTNHAGGAREQLDWLFAHGCRRPWLLGVREIPPMPSALWWTHRQNGFTLGCGALGLPVPPSCAPLSDPGFAYDPRTIDEQASITAGYLIPALAAGADAFLCINDFAAFRICRALHLLGRRPNHDVLVAGFDNNQSLVSSDYWTWCSGGPLITYDKLDAHLGETLVDLVMQRHHHQAPLAPQRITTSGQLITLIEPHTDQS